MTTTNYSDEAESPAAEPSQLLKTDVLGRTRMCRAQREAILDTFEASGMSGQAFALQHGIKNAATPVATTKKNPSAKNCACETKLTQPFSRHIPRPPYST